MKTLEKSLRNQLERTIKEARDIAEAAARASLDLGFGRVGTQNGWKRPWADLLQNEWDSVFTYRI